MKAEQRQLLNKHDPVTPGAKKEVDIVLGTLTAPSVTLLSGSSEWKYRRRNFLPLLLSDLYRLWFLRCCWTFHSCPALLTGDPLAAKLSSYPLPSVGTFKSHFAFWWDSLWHFHNKNKLNLYPWEGDWPMAPNSWFSLLPNGIKGNLLEGLKGLNYFIVAPPQVNN